MRIKLSRTEILNKLKILSKMPSQVKLGSGLGELVFFCIEDNELKIMVYDEREIFSVIKVEAIEKEVADENIFGINLKLLLSIVNKLENDIEIELKERCIYISSGKSRFEIYRSRLEEKWERSVMPNVEKEEFIECKVDALKLKKMFESVSVSVSEDKSNYLLSSVKLRIAKDEIELAATDGFRASIISEKMDSGINNQEVEFLLLSKSIGIIIRILSEGESVRLVATDEAILFEVAEMTVIVRTRRVDKYPNIKGLLSAEGIRVINIDRKEWVSAIDGIGNLGANIIKLESKDTECKVTVVGESDLSREYEVSGEVDVTYKGDAAEAVKMLFRNKLLIDGMKSVDSERVEVRIKGPNDFITIRPVEGSDQVNIVLPCRIR